MYITKLTCPNCNVSLEIDEGIREFSCPNCGSIIILEETLDYRNHDFDAIDDGLNNETLLCTISYCCAIISMRGADLRAGSIQILRNRHKNVLQTQRT